MASSPSPLLSLPSLSEVKGKDPERAVKYYSVLTRKDELFLPPDVSDFTVKEESTELSGVDGVVQILHDPHITLYTYHFEQRRAIFVKTPADKDLYTFPFLYLAQLKHATHLYSVPTELLEQVLLKKPNTFEYSAEHTSLKSEAQILFLFSTGRCGSTLLCKVLDKIDGVLGLQEPEPFTDLCYLRNTKGASDEDIITLLRISVLAHCKPKLHHPGDVQKWVFKFQSQVSEFMDLFPIAFPKSHNLFMYRNAEGVTKSISKMMSNLNDELVPLDVWTSLWTGLDWLPGDKKYSRDMGAVYWLCTVNRAFHFKKAGMNLPCVRYEELVAQTEKLVRTLAQKFDIKITEENMPRILDAMKGHSQEGVFTVYEHEGLENVLVTMRRLVSENKDIGKVDFILPDTLLV